MLENQHEIKMFFAFDPTKVRFERVKIKHVTTALGGSVSVLNEDHFLKTGKERFHKIPIPLSVARTFKVKYKISQFLIPHEGLLMWYDDKIITIEKAVENNRTVRSFEGKTIIWTSNTEQNYRNIYHSLTQSQWYFDGLYVYRFEKGIRQSINEGVFLDENKLFRAIKVQAYNLSYLNFTTPKIENRNCIAVAIDKNTFSISPPIWKTLDANVDLVNDDDSEDNEKQSIISSFKQIDQKVAVNINFALHAAKQLAEHFGYQSIQPLQLPQLMVMLNTVNLQQLPKEVKQFTDIGLPFTHGLMWLLGLLRNATTLQQFYTIRQLIKYLTTKGFYWKKNVRNTTTNNINNENTLPLFRINNGMLTQFK